MKTIVLLLLASNVFAVVCPTNYTEWEGVCAQLDAPRDKSTEPEINYASDEKPSRHPEPEWQRGEVKIAVIRNLAAEDIHMDQEKAQADAEGKAAAGIK